jgi:hypothetical protein
MYIKSGIISEIGLYGGITKIMFISKLFKLKGTQNEEADGDMWNLFRCCQMPNKFPAILRGISGMFRIL